jgi:Ulp1 family protease
MKKHIASFVLFACIISISFSCKKKDNVVVPKTKTELLTQSTWKFKNATFGGTDVSTLLQTCQKDNIVTFLKTGLGSLSEGATKCTSTDPDTIPFIWNFQSSETMLFISAILFTGGSNSFNVVSLTETDLTLSQDIVIGIPPARTIVVNFIH